jgi:hypothetical protein
MLELIIMASPRATSKASPSSRDAAPRANRSGHREQRVPHHHLRNRRRRTDRGQARREDKLLLGRSDAMEGDGVRGQWLGLYRSSGAFAPSKTTFSRRFRLATRSMRPWPRPQFGARVDFAPPGQPAGRHEPAQFRFPRQTLARASSLFRIWVTEPEGVSPDPQVTASTGARMAAGPMAFARMQSSPETKASSAIAFSNSVTSGDGRGNSSKAQRRTPK